MINKYVCVILVYMLSACSAPISEKLEVHLNKIGDCKALWTGIPLSYQKLFNDPWVRKLDSLSTEREKVYLSENHVDPKVRAVAFLLICKQNNDKCVQIALKHVKDTAVIFTNDGKRRFYQHLNSFRIDMIQNNVGTFITREDSCKIDSTLIHCIDVKGVLYYKNLFVRWEPSSEAYQYIKLSYEKGNNPYALIALAKYKTDEACKYIKNALVPKNEVYPYGWNRLEDIATYAIVQWPSPAFIPLLRQKAERDLMGEDVSLGENKIWLFQALMAYDAPWAFDLAEQSLKHVRATKGWLDERILRTRLYEAYLKTPNSRFEPLIAPIKNRNIDDYILNG